jgi:hypothetical protein
VVEVLIILIAVAVAAAVVSVDVVVLVAALVFSRSICEVVVAVAAVCPPSCLIPLIVDCYISTIASLKPQAMVVLIVVIVLDVALSLSFSTSISPSLVVWCHMASTPSEPTMTPQD